MAALEEIAAQVKPQNAETVRALAPYFWQWFGDHADDKVLTIHFLFISKTIRVRDLRPVFVLLFGNPPGSVA